MPESSPFAFYAFHQLDIHFHSKDIPNLTFGEIQKRFYSDCLLDKNKINEKSSLFITWKKRSKRSSVYELRGCIGTFAKLPLLRGIEKYSLVAALQDHRFPPIRVIELPQLECSCNILQNFRSIFSNHEGDIFDWELGTHGIELNFKDPKAGRIMSATFLPEVMPEQNWSKKDTFRNLIEKAGYLGDVDSLMDHYEDYFVEVIRYEGNKSQIKYDEYKDLMND
ncbi:LADA_0C05182g1_1 [Lachancea dasiensis]|uniref:LADA_0C05182g1_1 n=1 Tax=Lachancea dasiensis TaxID=1072105 RepID=A0A1G4IYX1_9SACH|nr:LADA_0C05182g1_1 [Lachancea dasiensis]